MVREIKGGLPQLPFLPLPELVALFYPIFLHFLPPSSLPPPAALKAISLQIRLYFLRPVAFGFPETTRSDFPSRPGRYKTCSPHVNTAHFWLRRFVNHSCSLVQPFTRSTLPVMMRNKPAVVVQAPGDVAGNGYELDLPANPKQRAPPKCSKCRNPGHRGQCETHSFQFQGI